MDSGGNGGRVYRCHSVEEWAAVQQLSNGGIGVYGRGSGVCPQQKGMWGSSPGALGWPQLLRLGMRPGPGCIPKAELCHLALAISVSQQLSVPPPPATPAGLDAMGLALGLVSALGSVDAFQWGRMVTEQSAPYPLHHSKGTPPPSASALCNGVGEDRVRGAAQ